MVLSGQTKKPFVIYLHGFASGPKSTKAQFFKSKFEQAGINVVLPDLNVPTFENLTITAQIEKVQAEMARVPSRQPVVLMGSSLGGLVAALVAEKENSRPVEKLILLAPAFKIKTRWQALLGENAMCEWKEIGSRPFFHYSQNLELPLSYGFIEDLQKLDTENVKTTVPTLIIHGINDTSVPVDCSRQFASTNQKFARLIELDDGHELIASTDRIWQDTERFLDMLKQSAAT